MQKFLFRQAANLRQLFTPRLNVLMYHRVMPEADPLRPWEIDKHQFRLHMQWISHVFNVIPLSEALEQLKAGCLKRRSLAITFDDGYLDNATHALPILEDFDFHATFFCTSAWLDGGLMWNDCVIESLRRWPTDSITLESLDLQPLPLQNDAQKNAAIAAILPKLKYMEHHKRQAIVKEMAAQIEELPDLMMKPKHIQQLKHAGMEIGGHTHSHPIIAKLDETSLRQELSQNKNTLEAILGKTIHLFAYPNGKPETDYLKPQIEHIKNAGYSAAVSTVPGIANKDSDIFELPRFTPWDKTERRYIARNILY